MAVYIGVDLHTRTQTVCWCDSRDGEICEAKLEHDSDDIRGFYAQFGEGTVIGIEASGYSRWFHKLMVELKHELRVGDAAAIRSCARRRQKNDRRDAQLLLDLLLEQRFPQIHCPEPESQEVMQLLRYRHRLVSARTRLKNGLQAIALTHGLRSKSRLWSEKGQQRLQRLSLNAAESYQRWYSTKLVAHLNETIEMLEKELRMRAEGDVRVQRLDTHPGVGLLTSLAMVHALEPVSRFSNGRQIAAYCGLDPRENSSGDRQRFGHISKQGNRLLRFLLVEVAEKAAFADPEMTRFYTAIKKRKNHAIAVTAVGRKLAVRLFVMLRDGLDYDEFRSRGRDDGYARETHNVHNAR